MSSHLRMEGVHAEIHYGYHVAATVDRWVIEDKWLSAHLVRPNAYQLTQGPLYFYVDNSEAGRPPFERQLLGVAVAADRLTATIGPRKGS